MLVQLSWFTLSIIFIIAMSTSKIIQKYALKDDDVNPIAFSAFFQFLIGILSIPLAAFNLKGLFDNAFIWVFVLIAILLYVSSTAFYYYGLKNVEVSQTDILSTTQSIWFLIGGFIFYNESVTLYKIIGVLFIILGLAIIYWKKGAFQDFGRYHVFILINALIASIALILDKYIVKFLPTGTYQTVAYLFTAIFTVAVIPSSFKKIQPLVAPNKRNLLILTSAAIYTLGVASLLTAYKIGGEISKIGPITQTKVILTVAFGILILNERQNTLRKLIGALIVCGGVIFLKFH